MTEDQINALVRRAGTNCRCAAVVACKTADERPEGCPRFEQAAARATLEAAGINWRDRPWPRYPEEAQASSIIPTEEAFSDKSGAAHLRNASTWLTVSETIRKSWKVVRVPVQDQPYFILCVDFKYMRSVYLCTDTPTPEPVGVIDFEVSTWPNPKGFLIPHSYFAPAHRGKGLAKMLYKWALDGGNALLSEGKQSEMSNNLWKVLSRDYRIMFIDEKFNVQYVGTADPELFTRPGIRMILLGPRYTNAKAIKALEKRR